jgi:hypothetical protein
MLPAVDLSIFVDTPAFDDLNFKGQSFVHLDEVPAELLDTVNPDEQGNDRVHVPGNPHKLEPVRKMLTVVKFEAVPAPVRIVPHHRDVKLGTIGVDSVAVKRALSKAGYIPWKSKWTRLFGTGSVKPLRKFQQDHGLHVDGVYGLLTHRKLVSLGAFDRFGAHLMGIAPYPISPAQATRNRIVANAIWGYHNRDRIGYEQWRPIDGHGHPFKLPLESDCSGTVEDWYEWGKGPDPSHLGFNGEGYTGTQVEHGTQTKHPQGADLNFYGWDYRVHGPMHVTIQVSSSDKSDLSVSHGTNAGPSLVARKYWSAYYESRSYI